MQVPTLNAIGGSLAVLALVAVVFFGVRQETPPKPQTVPIVAPAPVSKPPAKIASRRVNCKYVPRLGYDDKRKVLAAAAQYGASPAQVSALRVCL